MPTTSKKIQICEIWRQKSQSGNPVSEMQICLQALCFLSAYNQCCHSVMKKNPRITLEKTPDIQNVKISQNQT